MSNRRHYPPCVNRAGLSVLHHPQVGHPDLDIVFVHGLQGHPRKTWAKKTNAGHQYHHYAPKSQAAEANPLAVVDDHTTDSCCSDSDIFWPGHLLPHDLPNCRILTWGYDTMVTRGWTAVSQNNLFSHAKDFLYALERIHPKGRPIIFVAHSLGGIMVKELLRRSEVSRESTLQDIINSTVGVVFLGTPHRGSPDLASLAETVRRAASLLLRVDSNSTILRALGIDSPEFELCHDSFITQWRERNFRVKTFQEAYGISGLSVSRYGGKVVLDGSSLLGDPREHAESIAANHMDMVRFSGFSDTGYVKVKGELLLIIQTVKMYQQSQNDLRQAQLKSIKIDYPSVDDALIESLSSDYDPLTQLDSLRTVLDQISLSTDTTASTGPLPSLSTVRATQNVPQPQVATPSQGLMSAEEQECLQKLAYNEIDSRQSNIHSELPGTCQWILRDPVFVTWKRRLDVDNHGGLLWIKGKPGAGKSVMMKKILGLVRNEKLEPETIISFFFNARGSELERSTLGMFRSLVHQILRQDSSMRYDFASRYKERCRTIGENWEYQQFELQEFLLRSFSRRRDTVLYVFIDALDECKEEEVRGVAYYLRELTDRALAAGNILNVCISSRRYPTITLSRCPEIDLEKGNSGDINRYVQKRMAIHGSGQYLHDLSSHITQKASSVFLWAVLVVDMIHRVWDSGMGVAEIEKLIKQTPGQVKDVFEQLIETFSDDERAEACRLFQWTLFRGSGDVESLQYMMLFSTKHYPSFAALHRSEGKLDVETFRRRIIHLSRGLIEFVKVGSHTTLQVIHESVRDWLLYENGFNQLDKSIKNPKAASYTTILNTSIDILLAEDFFPIHPERQKSFTPTERGGAFWDGTTSPGIPYLNRKAVDVVTWYAVNFILWNAQNVEENESLPTRFLDMLSSREPLWTVIIRADTKRFLPTQYYSPLTLLCSFGFTKSLAYLVSNDISGFNRISPHSFRAALVKPFEETIKSLVSLCSIKDMRDSRGGCAMHWIFSDGARPNLEGYMKIAQIFLDAGLDINSKDDEGYTALWNFMFSANVQWSDREDFLSWLVTRGLNINLLDNHEKSILHHAVSRSSKENIQLLLKYGCSLDIRDSQGQLPLHLAAAKGDFNIMELLINAKSPINVPDSTGSTPLHAAAMSESFQLINKLINAGAHLNHQDKYGKTPLHLAAKSQPVSILEMMVGRGADTRVKDCFGFTPQDVAEMNDRSDYTLQMLEPRANDMH
jgi:protein SERAC1